VVTSTTRSRCRQFLRPSQQPSAPIPVSSEQLR
jgi:hypothetical protein